MARMPRLVAPGYPHHVTQCGARRMRTFFSAEDYQAYLNLLCSTKDETGVDVWAYCLMLNHVHLVVVPEDETGLARLFRHVHRHYTRRINFREKWKGHLWQERFHSFVMDERYLLAAVRYVELNPVRAKLCDYPQDWKWSSASAHLRRQEDGIVSLKPMLDRISDWAGYLSGNEFESEMPVIRRNSLSGRPVGSDNFIENLETLTGKMLKKAKPGPKAVIK